MSKLQEYEDGYDVVDGLQALQTIVEEIDFWEYYPEGAEELLRVGVNGQPFDVMNSDQIGEGVRWLRLLRQHLDDHQRGMSTVMCDESPLFDRIVASLPDETNYSSVQLAVGIFLKRVDAYLGEVRT